MGFIWNRNVASDPGATLPKQNARGVESGIAPQYQIVISIGEGNDKDGIVQGTQVFPIVASLPERYSIAVSSQWDAPFANKSLGDIAGGQTTDFALGTLGIGSRNKYQMGQVWQSSSPIAFNLDLVFNAQTNSKIDVMHKQLGLMKLVLPSEMDDGGGTLFAPGPNLIDSGLGGRNITLQLGTYMLMEHMIIKSVSSDVQTLCGSDGIPHSMTINVELETFYTSVTAQDLEKMFMHQG